MLQCARIVVCTGWSNAPLRLEAVHEERVTFANDMRQRNAPHNTELEGVAPQSREWTHGRSGASWLTGAIALCGHALSTLAWDVAPKPEEPLCMALASTPLLSVVNVVGCHPDRAEARWLYTNKTDPRVHNPLLQACCYATQGLRALIQPHGVPAMPPSELEQAVLPRFRCTTLRLQMPPCDTPPSTPQHQALLAAERAAAERRQRVKTHGVRRDAVQLEPFERRQSRNEGAAAMQQAEMVSVEQQSHPKPRALASSLRAAEASQGLRDFDRGHDHSDASEEGGSSASSSLSDSDSSLQSERSRAIMSDSPSSAGKYYY